MFRLVDNDTDISYKFFLSKDSDTNKDTTSILILVKQYSRQSSEVVRDSKNCYLFYYSCSPASPFLTCAL